MAEVSSTGGPMTDSLEGRLRFEQNKNRIIGRGDGNIPELIISADESGFYMRTSQRGVNVLTAREDQLVFNSRDNLFKIQKTGVVQLNSPNSAGSSSFVNVSYDLPNKPIVFAFVSFSPTGSAFPLPYLEPSLTTPGTIYFQIAYELVGNDLITFYHRDLAAASTRTDYIRYYLCRETAAFV